MSGWMQLFRSLRRGTSRRARDTAGTPPDDIKQRFPQIAPEVPRAFERTVQGRQGLLRIGWAIVRPSQSASNGATARP